MFPTAYSEILKQIEAIDPIAYGKTRNFGDGAVTRLSPYISRGLISTKMLMTHILAKDVPFYQVEKLVQELAWRDYWQQIWKVKGDKINSDFKRQQPEVKHFEIPQNLTEAQTGISAIDAGIRELKTTGYMHNHIRMYVAAIACNNAKSHWKVPAKWLFYYLLDADWASNALSWQWVAGSNSNKQYIANQDNINKYFKSNDKNTFLDLSYEEIANMSCPEHLRKTHSLHLKTTLPKSENFEIDKQLPTLIYNEYNLDPLWRKEEAVNSVLLLEPSRFEAYPMSDKTITFLLDLGKNIEGLKIFTGSFQEFTKAHTPKELIYKEHPLNVNYSGTEDSRDWMFSVEGYHSSFFQFWKKCKKEMKQDVLR